MQQQLRRQRRRRRRRQRCAPILLLHSFNHNFYDKIRILLCAWDSISFGFWLWFNQSMRRFSCHHCCSLFSKIRCSFFQHLTNEKKINLDFDLPFNASSSYFCEVFNLRKTNRLKRELCYERNAPNARKMSKWKSGNNFVL